MTATFRRDWYNHHLAVHPSMQGAAVLVPARLGEGVDEAPLFLNLRLEGVGDDVVVVFAPPPPGNRGAEWDCDRFRLEPVVPDGDLGHAGGRGFFA